MSQEFMMSGYQRSSWRQIAQDKQRGQTTTKPRESAKLNENAKGAKPESRDHHQIIIFRIGLLHL